MRIRLDDLMTKTPIGNTIDVEYMRDGEKKIAKLTTISARTRPATESRV